MTLTVYKELIQGSPEWLQARCGLLTASEMQRIVTPAKLKAADNDKSRAHLYELLAQRVTQYVEPTYVGEHMLRGEADEGEALNIYEDAYEVGHRVGFMTNGASRWVSRLTCSSAKTGSSRSNRAFSASKSAPSSPRKCPRISCCRFRPGFS